MGTLYTGAYASALATAVGHYPWFSTFNWLNDRLPNSEEALLKVVCLTTPLFSCPSLVRVTLRSLAPLLVHTHS